MRTSRVHSALATLALVLAAASLGACESEGYSDVLPIDGSSQPSSGSAGPAKQAATKR